MRVPVLAIAALLCGQTSVSFGETPWEAYLRLPSAVAASRVKRAEYTPPASAKESFEYDLALLEYQVTIGDRESLNLAVRLSHQYDAGHWGELIDEVLGHGARIDALGFLLAIRSETSCPGVLMTGWAFVDRLEAQQAEIELRLRAIRSVKDPRVEDAQRRCVAVLDDYLRRSQPHGS